MSTLPPPLPAPAQAQPRPGASFVTLLAWISIVAAALGLAYSVVQVLSGLFAPDLQMRMLNPSGAELPPLPPLVQWYYANTAWLGAASLLVSAVLLAVSRGLLQRREWARRGFIALLLLGTLWQLAWVWITPQIVEATLGIQMGALAGGEDAAGLAELTDAMVSMTTIAVAVLVAVFTVLHAWIVWKLCTAPVRAEFEAREA